MSHAFSNVRKPEMILNGAEGLTTDGKTENFKMIRTCL